MGCSGFFFFCEAEGFADSGRDVVAAGDLLGVFGDGLHHVDDVDDLELALFAAFDGFLAGDHEDGHAAELSVGCGGDEIGCAGAECG